MLANHWLEFLLGAVLIFGIFFIGRLFTRKDKNAN
jgi:hypothetical protein